VIATPLRISGGFAPSALDRYRARRGQRGAAVFLVILVITLLGAMGVFASRAAGLTEAAAGYDRSGEQAEYLAQYGAMLVASEINRVPSAALMLYNDQNKPQTCKSQKWFPAMAGYVPKCLPYNQEAIAGSTAVSGATAPIISPAVYTGGGSVSNPASYDPGSLGPTPLTGLFDAEAHDINEYPRPIAGSNVGTTGTKFGYYMVSVSTMAQVSPLLQNGKACGQADELTALVASRLVGRGYVILGPVPKP
jgi:hypothetical protein